MLWVMFLSAWVGLAFALQGRRRWWVVGPVALAMVCWLAGMLAPLAVAFYASPFAGIALALIAGWTRALRPNLALGAVTLAFLIAEAGLLAQTSDGPGALDGFTGFAVLVLAVAAIGWVLGRSAHELMLRARRRDAVVPLEAQLSSAAVPRRPVVPPPPRS